MGLKYNRFLRGAFFFSKTYLRPPTKSFGKLGVNVTLTPPMYIGNPRNIFIGDNVGIGPNANISATNAKFIIEGNCAIAEGLTVHTGNHARVLGKLVTEINEKNKPDGFDQDVIIEEDVWIGCNVTLLAGITISRGATIAAGAVVNKNIPPYCIAGGVPAHFIKFYWNIEDIMIHEEKLYSKEDRFTQSQLKEIFEIYEKKD